MNTVDYDKALYYTHRSQWDNLLILMVRTQDDLLSKRIEHFLHAYNFEHDYRVIEEKLYALLRYIDHATSDVQEEQPVFSFT
ncbi:YhdB family protein [Bacillus kexueae]|uniref:YhdB family protein n=1 Tax=Aeribacillus kexueae TaxID=2078952 RepID=UPI001FAEC1E1